MTTESLKLINRFGENLELFVRVPGDKIPYKSVLFVPGFGQDLHGDNNSHDEIAACVVAQGMLTVQFSFAGCGASDGDFREMTLERQARQIEDVLIWMKERADVDPDCIGILATSLGVPSVLLTNLFDAKTFVFISGIYNPAMSLPLIIGDRQTTAGGKLLLSVNAFTSRQAAGNVTQPTLVIHGEKDTKTTLSDVQVFIDALGTTEHAQKFYPEGDHGMIHISQSIKDSYIAEIGHWFASHL